MSYTLGRRPALLATLVGVGLVGAAGTAHADGASGNVKLELGAFGGVHLFANDLELGVADDPTLTSPKNSGLAGVRLGVALPPRFAIELEGGLPPPADPPKNRGGPPFSPPARPGVGN